MWLGLGKGWSELPCLSHAHFYHFAEAGKMINLGKIVLLEVGDFLTVFLNKRFVSLFKLIPWFGSGNIRG